MRLLPARPIPEGYIRIHHPVCGERILVTRWHITTQRKLIIEGVCHTCGVLVVLQHEFGSQDHLPPTAADRVQTSSHQEDTCP